jgi:hypothetical protein
MLWMWPECVSPAERRFRGTVPTFSEELKEIKLPEQTEAYTEWRMCHSLPVLQMKNRWQTSLRPITWEVHWTMLQISGFIFNKFVSLHILLEMLPDGSQDVRVLVKGYRPMKLYIGLQTCLQILRNTNLYIKINQKLTKSQNCDDFCFWNYTIFITW